MNTFIMELLGFINIHRYTVRAAYEVPKSVAQGNGKNTDLHDKVIEYIKKYPGIINSYGGFRPPTNLSVNYSRIVQGQTVLYIACDMGDDNMTKRLLELGADPNKYCRSHDNTFDYFARTRTPLIVACMNQNVECMELLIADPRTDLNLVDKKTNKTALQMLQDVAPHLIGRYVVKKRETATNKV